MTHGAAPRVGALATGVAMLIGSCVALVVCPVAAAGPSPQINLPLQAAPPFDPPPANAQPPFIAASDGVVLLGSPPSQGSVLLGRVGPGASGLTLDGQPVRTAPDGRFIVAFGRDAAPVAEVRVRLPGAGIGRIVLRIAAGNWPTETVAGVPRFTQPSAEFRRRRPAEVAQIDAARRGDGAADAGVDGWLQAFIWPVTGRITGHFGAQRVYANGERGAPHAGVDIARPVGTLVVAPADGVVVLAAAAPFTLEGNLLLIDHGMGLNSAFLHLSRIDVHVGDRVRQGQPIGAVGMTGRASGPHLHWGMKWLDQRIDPALMSGPMR